MYTPSLASIMSLVAATPLHAWPLIGSAPARRVCQLGAFDCAVVRVENDRILEESDRFGEDGHARDEHARSNRGVHPSLFLASLTSMFLIGSHPCKTI